MLCPIIDAERNTPEWEYTTLLRRTRVTVEQTIGIFKQTFRCLHSDRSLHYNPRFAAQIIQACGVMYNYLRHYGLVINIKKTYTK